MSSKDKAKKSQLLSPDGWENYQKELTRLCFEFWEVNEKQVQLNNSLQSDLTREPAAEIQLPSSLFADKHNNSHKNTVGIESKVVSLNSITISEEFTNNEFVEINSNVFKSKPEDGPVMKQLSTVINNYIDWQSNGNSSKIVDVKGNERSKRKILKRFSFYKHSSSKQVKLNKQHSLTYDRYSSCTLKDWRKCKKWLETVEKIKTLNPNASALSGNIEENLEVINFDGRSDTFVYNSLDIEAMQMEQKIKELVKSISEKDKLILKNVDDVNVQTTAKFGPSNNFKYPFKNVFQGSRDELDLRLLNDYTKYIHKKLNTWRALSDCLDDVRRRMSGKVNNTATGAKTAESAAIKYRCSETNKDHRGDRGPQVMTDARYDESNNRSKIVETSEDFDGTSGQKKYNFFKLLNKKTKRSVDTRTAATCRGSNNRTGRNGVGEIRTNYGNNNDYNCDGCSSSVIRIGGGDGGKNTLINHCGVKPYADGRKRTERIRKSLSDTDLPSMLRTTPPDHGDCETGDAAGRDERDGRETLTLAEAHSIADDQGEGCSRAYYFCRDDVARGMWEDRQECFQTVVARLEYVGSTFRESRRLAGLKALCKVDVLAGFGHPAEAVDIFVQSALPLSDNPDLMIRKAEAAYDWKFFCHLSMWRHSYKE